MPCCTDNVSLGLICGVLGMWLKMFLVGRKLCIIKNLIVLIICNSLKTQFYVEVNTTKVYYLCDTSLIMWYNVPDKLQVTRQNVKNTFFTFIYSTDHVISNKMKKADNIFVG